MSEIYYDSDLSGEELDEAFRKMGNLDESVAAAAASAKIAEEAAERATQITYGARGWYQSEAALTEAHPTGEAGQWAIVGDTNSIWVWDGKQNKWVNSNQQLDPSLFYTREEADDRFSTTENVRMLMPFLYKASFLESGWTGEGPYTQTVAVQAVDGGPDITEQSHMTSGLFLDDTLQGEERSALQEAAALVDSGTKTFGSGTITCVLQEEKPAADAEVYFNARKGGL